MDKVEKVVLIARPVMILFRVGYKRRLVTNIYYTSILVVLTSVHDIMFQFLFV